MLRSRSVAIGLLLVALFVGATTGQSPAVSAAGPHSGEGRILPDTGVQVTLSAALTSSSRPCGDSSFIMLVSTLLKADGNPIGARRCASSLTRFPQLWTYMKDDRIKDNTTTRTFSDSLVTSHVLVCGLALVDVYCM